MKKVLMALCMGFALCLLSGCVHHLDKQECINTDWHSMGYNDGAAGRAERDLNSAIEDCLKFKVPVNTQGYLRGYRKGLTKFCTPPYAMGLNDGRRGLARNLVIQARTGVCSAGGVSLKLNAYDSGRAKGLHSFCTYQNGYNLARAGHQAPQVCTGRLAKRFMRGWNKGDKQFCSDTQSAFALGRAGKPYPSACDPRLYAGFKNAYDRGRTVNSRVRDLQGQLNDVNSQISRLVYDHHLKQFGDNSYGLSHRHKRPADRAALNQVRHLARERQRLQSQLFKAKLAQ